LIDDLEAIGIVLAILAAFALGVWAEHKGDWIG
jgi:hypothetical protein